MENDREITKINKELSKKWQRPKKPPEEIVEEEKKKTTKCTCC